MRVCVRVCASVLLFPLRFLGRPTFLMHSTVVVIVIVSIGIPPAGLVTVLAHVQTRPRSTCVSYPNSYRVLYKMKVLLGPGWENLEAFIRPANVWNISHVTHVQLLCCNIGVCCFGVFLACRKHDE